MGALGHASGPNGNWPKAWPALRCVCRLVAQETTAARTNFIASRFHPHPRSGGDLHAFETNCGVAMRRIAGGFSSLSNP